MSVSLLEVIEAGGYNIRTYEDANWLLSKRNEFDELVEKAEEIVNKAEEEESERLDKEYKERWGEL